MMKRKATAVIVSSMIMLSCVSCSSHKNVKEADQQMSVTIKPTQEPAQEDANEESNTTKENENVTEGVEQTPAPTQPDVNKNELEDWSYHKKVKQVDDHIYYQTYKGIFLYDTQNQRMSKIYDAKEKTLTSYCIHKDRIYFVQEVYAEFDLNTTIYSMNLDGSDVRVELDHTINDISIACYEDSIYLTDWENTVAYAINEDGTIGKKCAKKETLLGQIQEKMKNQECEFFDTPIDTLNKTGLVWFQTENGSNYSYDPVTEEIKEYDFKGGRVDGITKQYMICYNYEYDENDHEISTYYLYDRSNGSYKKWFSGNKSYLDSDAGGSYFELHSEDNKVHTYQYIDWNGTVSEAFSAQVIPGMRSQTGNGVNDFSVIGDEIYYSYPSDYKMYLMNRDTKDISVEKKMGEPLSDTNYSKFGHVEEVSKTIRAKSNEKRVLGTIDYDCFVFDGKDESSQKMKSLLEEFMKASVQSWTNDITEDEEMLTEDVDGIEYSFTSYLDGITVLSDRYICLNQSEYVFTGGAHGMPSENYYVFDVDTGERLLLPDIVSNTEDELKEKLDRYFDKMYQKDKKSYWEDAPEAVHERGGYMDTFYLTKTGIVFYFYPYELASYAQGFIRIEVPYTEFDMKISF